MSVLLLTIGDFVRDLTRLLSGRPNSTTPLDDPSWGDGER